ncbi:hypothetical protein D6D17_10556 [Aureobasidium pullulans]|nr:hypothetical protein D6D26_04571 [Aureobasidium pullulans]THW75097.1 hypothetical protein D6D17_10556 [Aureobasidium pullulans]
MIEELSTSMVAYTLLDTHKRRHPNPHTPNARTVVVRPAQDIGRERHPGTY